MKTGDGRQESGTPEGGMEGREGKEAGREGEREGRREERNVNGRGEMKEEDEQ